jgi:Bacteriocin-protection, YdeI or OmpD-Associated/Domain of unknown function (DUF1905)
MRFRTTVLRAGKTATGIQVPDEIVDAMGSGKRPPVRVTINGYTYRSTIASMGGRFMVGVSAEVRDRAHVRGGDAVDVDVELDRSAREVEVPPDLAKALKRDAKARKAFDALSYSNKQRHVLSIEGAKTEETRQRRIDKAIQALHEAGG